jgi:ADP-heptose:LPS heptosyltransferase
MKFPISIALPVLALLASLAFRLAHLGGPLDEPLWRQTDTAYMAGHVGDVLHTVPLMRALRAARPQGDLTWIVGPWCAGLARRYAFANRVEVFSPAWEQYRRGQAGPWFAEQAAWGRAQQPVEVFVSTANADLATLFVGRSLRPTWWCGRPPACLLYPVAAREDIRSMKHDCPEAEDILHLAEPLGVTGAAELFYDVREEEREAARQVLAESGIAPEVPYVVIASGAGWAGKQWPLERWAAVADELHLMGCAIALVGTAGETVQCQTVATAMRAPPAMLAGRTTLPELAAIIAGARMWLGSDSGGLHLAAAVGTPTLSLFGPTNPAKWAPRGSQHRFLRAVDGCPRCVPWHPRARCAEDAHCMKQLEVDAVRRAASDIFEYNQRQEHDHD